jgi:hypothetical protein
VGMNAFYSSLIQKIADNFTAASFLKEVNGLWALYPL